EIEEVIARSTELLAVFDEHGDQRGAERATTELARQHFFAGRAKTAEQILSTRIARYPPAEAPFSLVRWLPTVLRFGPTPVEEAVQRLSDMLRTSTSRTVQVSSLAALGSLSTLVGRFDEGKEMIRRALAVLDDLGMRRMAVLYSGNYLADAERLAGRPDDAEKLLLSAYEELSATGDRGFSATIAGYLAHLYIERGAFDEAGRYAEITRQAASPDDVDAVVRALSATARVLSASGELQEAQAMASEAAAVADTTDYLDFRGERHSDLAEVLIAAGRSADAADALRHALQNFEAKGATVHVQRVRSRLDEITGR
ncbi:MAG: hypothetical protein M3253_05650, partial [Chloroflexota bacterium]|nr:hypothetical protein [Chloroflexota bacterium]